ncbi:BFH_HP2_G0006090.mRNA.1.CDS.1 [Saccharomyces cerevisiae]|nr:BFH_HP2_G0006090.mRNA.1.CDS.1 [Saccharomyces cerevisiae]CAI6411002.1 BFH_HP2_G0006090.mRNA.1.CDS.1 [Saccharomyces cerevisiae]
MKYHLVALLSLLTQKPGELPPNSSSSSIQRLVMGKFTIFQQRVYKNGLYDVPRILEDIKIGKNSGEKLVAVLN